MSIAIRWPDRKVQLIPLSTETIRLQVKKGDSVLAELPLGRPGDDGSGVLVSSGQIRLDANTGLTVEAQAFRAGSTVPIASAASTSVTVVANQRVPVALSLSPVFVPTLTGFSPTNGGPGVPVTLTGSFGDSGYYGIRLGGARGPGSASGSTVIANVPSGAKSGPVYALADGVPSSPGATFSVLTSLGLGPASATVALNATESFSVPTGTDTENQSVAEPTLTRWEVIDPAKLNDIDPASPVGTITTTGIFTAQAIGTAWIRVWSGSLFATASVTVN